MKIYQNVEHFGFRFTIIVETNDKLSHKLISENSKIEDYVKSCLEKTGRYIVLGLDKERQDRKLDSAIMLQRE